MRTSEHIHTFCLFAAQELFVKCILEANTTLNHRGIHAVTHSNLQIEKDYHSQNVEDLG